MMIRRHYIRRFGFTNKSEVNPEFQRNRAFQETIDRERDREEEEEEEEPARDAIKR